MLEPISEAIEPICEDPSLTDPTTSKYQSNQTYIKTVDATVPKERVTKMNYATKFNRAKFSGEALQPSTILHKTTKNNKKRKTIARFESKDINYTKKL